MDRWDREGAQDVGFDPKTRRTPTEHEESGNASEGVKYSTVVMDARLLGKRAYPTYLEGDGLV